MSSALAGGFLTTGPPGKSPTYFFDSFYLFGCAGSSWAFFSCGEWELLFLVVHGVLAVIASLVVEQRL